jgi:hypothetical protein
MQFRRRLRGCRAALLALLCTVPALAGEARALRPGTARVAPQVHTRAHPLRVQGGVLTVDGLTVKTGLNLRVANLHYLYIFVPGTGTAIVSDQPFAGASEQKAGFNGNVLMVQAGERRLELTATHRMHGTHAAYVRLERGMGPALREPAISFGDASWVPAVWPEQDAGPAGAHGHKSRGRMLRSAKLCRPSPHGHEVCAVVHEVLYRPR